MRNWKRLTFGIKKGVISYPPQVGIVVATYDQDLSVTLGSLQAQTYKEFVCLVIHDGPPTNKYKKAQQYFKDDSRFVFRQCGDVRANKFGHNCRKFGFDILSGSPGCFAPDLLCTTNGDNYHVPVYLETLAHALCTSGKKWAICDMVHSHRGWVKVDGEPERKRVDAASWMATAEVLRKVRWDKEDFAADWDFCSRVKEAFGPPAKVDRVLLVHN